MKVPMRRGFSHWRFPWWPPKVFEGAVLLPVVGSTVMRGPGEMRGAALSCCACLSRLAPTWVIAFMMKGALTKCIVDVGDRTPIARIILRFFADTADLG